MRVTCGFVEDVYTVKHLLLSLPDVALVEEREGCINVDEQPLMAPKPKKEEAPLFLTPTPETAERRRFQNPRKTRPWVGQMDLPFSGMPTRTGKTR